MGEAAEGEAAEGEAAVGEAAVGEAESQSLSEPQWPTAWAAA